ncbi:hypothetical protein M9H77_14571 [Catharanthus roseus]|uniref:Uncharacterized protein n=1 Tax=Catharanthus roseus TaxID=4058 RepID=A0ACC0BNN0_CATRO|nr:hypothetical protein M9H77_14571 [Catharanthus roseus]
MPSKNSKQASQKTSKFKTTNSGSSSELRVSIIHPKFDTTFGGGEPPIQYDVNEGADRVWYCWRVRPNTVLRLTPYHALRWGYFLVGWVRRGSPARIVQGGLVVPKGTQVPYLIAVDLAKGYGVSQVVSWLYKVSRLGHRWIYKDGTIIRGSAGSRPSSSYSLREIHLERPSLAVVDILDSDSETIDGPTSIEMDIEEDPNEPTIGSAMDTAGWIKNVLRVEMSEEPSIEPTSGIPASPTSLSKGSTSDLPISLLLAEIARSCFPVPCLSLEQGLQAVESQIVALQAELARTSRCFHSFRQARQLETARVDRLAVEVAQMRGTLEAQQYSMS